MRAAKVQASLRIRAVSPEPSLLAHTSSESRGTFRQKARSLALLTGWACAVEICHDGMLEDTNSLDAAQINLIISAQFHLEQRMARKENKNNPLNPICHSWQSVLLPPDKRTHLVYIPAKFIKRERQTPNILSKEIKMKVLYVPACQTKPASVHTRPIYETQHYKTNKMSCAPSEDSDQTRRIPA